jgi:hypothetical protein
MCASAVLAAAGAAPAAAAAASGSTEPATSRVAALTTAGAGQSAGGKQLVASFGRKATTNAAVPGPEIITCEIQTHNPHRSAHVPGTVNVVADVTCSWPVEWILGHVELFRDTGSNGVGFGYDITYRQMTAQPKADTGCVTGFYIATGSAGIYAPEGYWPEYGEIWENSAAVSITC